jgi:hypothetical protein
MTGVPYSFFIKFAYALFVVARLITAFPEGKTTFIRMCRIRLPAQAGSTAFPEGKTTKKTAF